MKERKIIEINLTIQHNLTLRKLCTEIQNEWFSWCCFCQSKFGLLSLLGRITHEKKNEKKNKNQFIIYISIWLFLLFELHENKGKLFIKPKSKLNTNNENEHIYTHVQSICTLRPDKFNGFIATYRRKTKPER